ncbi:hypothetical protein A2697_03545 [Candidatus Curtissbacteria bacterium RIFCSPHIGHO2_01_FULL_41_44]|uniref:Uncharacterized protein n=1 Tax=Candidatus Curtissbacteria bacterium RIFCSPLOWO2_01_FULL_42_50 TaxID=1797730 RepID=A0A1F5H7G0_9BACT|nr:MAG: hypothetical protein A2697_03545 [Candidatus Curtissbacteria bacterium RIFCSPHIGHO2_01_FULL_41_44]OGD94240.1 MAG: hypothetical protein A3C33_02700 [Candidatus Curtissbacteria bacterium RIFCSPHIGHO2_02_FULL_42_58]OGD97714.1 MAG: hypothetical protein A3E71_03210 [Candidatus Curtissbacteria bacterium RIFCSPHIGHO2_12_FULL_42_33]OGE00107.1 MAG: hypothetical protein A3B54_01760 [Candidatus Curtissbacteria bacterium RIFCSPLOWO2_01_FULL_42_50]OGE02032.1 MAG: hypothetical protein A3G16_00065 [Ca
MSSVGAKIRWCDGKILHPSIYWKSPSKRRLPRLLIEDRALEVGVLIYVEEPWIVFRETNQKAEDIDSLGAIELEVYQGKFNLLPEKFKRQDTYQWMAKKNNALLLWGMKDHYFVKAAGRES